ncbi:hypothetical protein, partial [Propylenella binzhouense]|uniref:hypothetical protein n=1 Tax=Propylenella binzhouense TaxID=2555902 RepID=UPI0019689D37
AAGPQAAPAPNVRHVGEGEGAAEAPAGVAPGTSVPAGGLFLDAGEGRTEPDAGDAADGGSRDARPGSGVTVIETPQPR